MKNQQCARSLASIIFVNWGITHKKIKLAGWFSDSENCVDEIDCSGGKLTNFFNSLAETPLSICMTLCLL